MHIKSSLKSAKMLHLQNFDALLKKWQKMVDKTVSVW